MVMVVSSQWSQVLVLITVVGIVNVPEVVGGKYEVISIDVVPTVTHVVTLEV